MKYYLTTILLIISNIGFTQLVEPIRHMMDVAGDVQVALEFSKVKAEQQADLVKRDIEKDLAAAKEEAKKSNDMAWFIANASHIESIMNSVNALICLLDEYKLLIRKRSKNYSSSCYENIHIKLYDYNIKSSLLSLRSLFNATKNHVSSIDRSLKLIKANDAILDIADDLKTNIDSEKEKEKMISYMQSDKDARLRGFKNNYYTDLNSYRHD